MSIRVYTIIQAPLQILFVTGQASKTVLTNKKYRLAFFILVPLMFLLFVTIPAYSIPSNNFRTQFALYELRDYFIVAAMSFLTALFFLMHAYVFTRMRQTREKAGALSAGGVGGSAGALASVFGAATCPMCVASIFGFLGAGAVGFLVQYQWWVFTLASLLMLTSLYFVSKKVNGACKKCI